MAGRVYPALAAARVVSVAPGAQGHSAGRRAGLVGMTANRPERRPPATGHRTAITDRQRAARRDWSPMRRT